jgi:N-acetylglucosamine kinase-like BadF-type ATPase
MDIVLGIDAGGSKTLALAAGPDGRELGRARGGPGNYHAVGFAAASSAITDAVRDALHAAGAEASQVRSLCLGAAGVDRPEDGALWMEWARQAFPDAAARIVNDALIVLAAGGSAGCCGLAVIAGTGSIVYGRAEDGRTARAGGWGYLLGDEGSNYAIGLAALRAACRAADDRGPDTLLTQMILKHWGLAQPADLVGKVYGEIARKDIARLGRVVEMADAAGDVVAGAILEEAGVELALAARSVVRRLALEGPYCCAMAGAVLLRGPRVQEAFLASSMTMGLQFDPLARVEEPAVGAVTLAVEGLERHSRPLLDLEEER